MKVVVRGRGEVSLPSNKFVASGGFGDVYAVNGVAYKIYRDRSNVIPVQKINELSVLTDSDVIRPLDPLYDVGGGLIGYTMRYLKDTYTLCELYPRGFRDRAGLTPEKTLNLVELLRSKVAHCHVNGVVIVDLNELNELVDRSFDHLYLIDVDNYKTRSFPAQGLMDSVRDYHAKVYDELSDWFSFAVVAFNLLIGIHPFKGRHPVLGTDLAARMRANVSVFNPEVQFPRGSVLPFDVIPEVYLRWFEGVFERGLRSAPPDGLVARIVLGKQASLAAEACPSGASAGGDLEVVRLCGFPESVVESFGGQFPVTVTTSAIYLGSSMVVDSVGGVSIGFTGKLGRPIAARVDEGRLKLLGVVSKQLIPFNLDASQVMSCDGRIVVLSNGGFVEVEILELGSQTVASPRLVGSAFENSTRLYDGVALQCVLGVWFADLFPLPGQHRQVRLDELRGLRVVEARYRSRVLQVVVVDGVGVYSRLVFRFSEDFSRRDVRVVGDVVPSGLNFVVLDSGVVVQINEQVALEVFLSQVGSVGIRTVVDPVISGDMRLGVGDSGVVFWRGGEVFSLRLR